MKFLVTLFLLLPLIAFSQKLPESDALNRVILNHQDSIIYAHVLPEDQKQPVRTSNDSWYYWYAQHDIKSTRGGYDGKLLHGDYTEYYNNKELKRKGSYKKGLRSGEWKAWYKTGQLSEIVHYKNGLKEGSSIVYEEDGTVRSSGEYKKGILTNKRKTVKTADAEQEKLKKQRKKKEKVRVRKSLEIVPQPGKST